jgi:hypothetical protein
LGLASGSAQKQNQLTGYLAGNGVATILFNPGKWQVVASQYTKVVEACPRRLI